MRAFFFKVQVVHFVHVVQWTKWTKWTPWTRCLWATAVLIALAPALACAQQTPATGSLRITVLGPNGQPISSAIVLVQQNGKPVTQDRTTAAGESFLNRLSPGTYTVLVKQT